MTLSILREKLIKYFEDYHVINYIYKIGNKSFAIYLNQLETRNVLRICLKRNNRLDTFGPCIEKKNSKIFEKLYLKEIKYSFDAN